MRLHHLLLPVALGLLAACGGATGDGEGVIQPGAGGTAGTGGTVGVGGGSGKGGSAGKGGSVQGGLGGSSGSGGDAGSGSVGGSSGSAGTSGSAGVGGAGGAGGAAGAAGAGPCSAMDAQGQGPCAVLVGWVWTGNQCIAIGGCSCAGADCGQLTQSAEACQKAHSGCGAYQPCAGKVCGDQCSTCPPGDPGCPKPSGPSYCDQSGVCSQAAPTCGLACKSDFDCPQTGTPCQVCPDGSTACAGFKCIANQCQFEQQTCGPPTCAPQAAFGVGGCEVLLGWVWDGTQCSPLSGCSCQGPDCGALAQDPDTCNKLHDGCLNPPSPCSGQPCGSSCSLCGPDQPCDVFGYCDQSGQCTPSFPVCGLQCKDPSQCPVTDGPCIACPDGSASCPEPTCFNGQCGQQYPPCGAVCKVASDCPPQPCSACPDGTLACPKTDCLNGACVTSVPSCQAGPCAPQDAFGNGLCDGFFGYKWDGAQCTLVGGCSCQGADCQKLPFDPDTCVKEHSFCAQDTQCKSDSDCPQPGLPCEMCQDGSLSCPTNACIQGQCIFDFPQCAASCTPAKAGGIGACDKLLGYLWDGGTCAAVTGCDCTGPDCDQLTPSPDECFKKHEPCFVF
jgi:hypothetical protein